MFGGEESEGEHRLVAALPIYPVRPAPPCLDRCNGNAKGRTPGSLRNTRCQPEVVEDCIDDQGAVDDLDELHA